jgi:peptide/nickel transport system substrate-binding protein
MESRDEKEGVASGGLTRKQFLQTGAAVGLGAGLVGSGLMGAGCGGGGTTPSGSPSPTGAGKAGGIMQVATDQLFPKDSLDPLTNITDGVDMVQGAIREGLVTYDFTFGVMPRLAESWELSPDATKYTFKIRPNVTWHNGKPFTAQDAAWSLDRVLDPDVGAGLYSVLSASLDRSGIKVVDDMTLELNLKRPDSLLLLPLSNQQAYLTPADSTSFEDGVGTGPFKLKSWEPGRSWELEKYAGYWASGEPLLDGVRGIQIPEASTKLQSVASGDSHVTEINYETLPVVEQNSGLQVVYADKMIFFNAVMDITVKPFTDARVVEAMKRSIDREAVMRVAFAKAAFMSPDAPVATGDPFMDAALDARLKMDRPAAEKLMAEAGFPNGIDLTFKVPSDPLHATFGLGVAEGLKGSPFRIKVKQEPAATYWDTVWMKDSFYMSDWNRRHPIIAMGMMVYSKSTQNETKWSSPEMDALLAKAVASTGDELTKLTTEACLLFSNSCSMLIPAYRNRVWCSKVGTTVQPWTHSMLDFRKMALA